MENEKDVQYVEAIKLAAGGVQYKNLSVKKTLIDAVQQLNSFYKNSGDIGSKMGATIIYD